MQTEIHDIHIVELAPNWAIIGVAALAVLAVVALVVVASQLRKRRK